MPYTYGMINFNSRITGVVFGTAVGDALGYQCEFNKSVQPVKDLASGGLYSDDTQMLLATLDGLFEARTWADLEAAGGVIAKHYVAWSRSPENNRAPGGACMYGCGQLAKGVEWREAGKPLAGGCGAAMRSMAYGLWHHDNVQKATEWAAEHALMTHRHAIGPASAAAVAAGVAMAMQEGSKNEIATQMIAAARKYDPETADMLQLARDLAAAPESPMGKLEAVLDKWRGWAGHEAVAASLFCFMRYDTFESAVLAAVNSPGDSDSLGAITGALAGAFYGAETIPNRWTAEIENAVKLSAMAASLYGTLRT